MLRINLLLDTERRYQGMVSRRFVLQAVGGLLAAAAVLWIVQLIYDDARDRQSLKTAREQWAQKEPAYKKMSDMEAGIHLMQSHGAELDIWASTRFDLASFVDFLQREVPSTIQIVRFTYEDDFNVPSSKPGEDAPKNPGLGRIFKARVAGQAFGPDARQQVECLIARLEAYQAATNGPPALEYARLVSIQSPSARSDGGQGTEEGRAFDVEMGGKWRVVP